ncbi:MAG: hypothetical protein AB7G28_26210 [Pirellulales bacterium]
MSSFGNGPPGPWDHKFTFVEGPGSCLSTLIGFCLFLVVVAAVRHFFF